MIHLRHALTVPAAVAGGGSAPNVRAITSWEFGVITLPTRITGDILLLAVHDCEGTLTTPSGWTQKGIGSPTFGVYSRAVDGTESAPAWPVTGGHNPTWICLSIMGASAVEDSGTTSLSGGITSVNAPSVTAAGANRLLVTIGAFRNPYSTIGCTLTLPAGQTVSANVRSQDPHESALRVGYEVVGSGATGTRTVTGSHAANANNKLGASSILFKG